jgi:hypothetical protein
MGNLRNVGDLDRANKDRERRSSHLVPRGRGGSKICEARRNRLGSAGTRGVNAQAPRAMTRPWTLALPKTHRAAA